MDDTLARQLAEVVAARAGGRRHAARSAVGKLVRTLRQHLPDDPLLAGALLEVIDDEDLRAALQARTGTTAPRTGRVPLPLVGPDGAGHLAELVLTMVPGTGGVWSAQPAAEETTLAAQVAVAVALGAEASRWRVRWQIVPPLAELSGTSLGVGVYLAARAARTGRAIVPGHALTGALALDGTVEPVRGLHDKLAVTRTHGLTLVLPALQTTGEPDQRPVAHATDLDALLAPAQAPAAPRRWRPLTLLALPAVAWLGLAGPADALLQLPLLGTLTPPLPAEHTAVALLDDPGGAALRSQRPDWGPFVAAAAAHGAAGVVFDMSWTDALPGDESLAATLRQTDLPVILAAPLRADRVVPPATPALAEAVRVGHTTFGQDPWTGAVRSALVQQRVLGEDEAVQPLWHLAVAGLSALTGADPRLHDGTLAVGISKNPVTDGRVWLAATAPSPSLDPTDPGRWPDLSGRVVVVGVAGADRDWFLTASGRRHGAELHAALIETLARQAAPRRAPGGADVLLSLLAAGAGAAATRSPRGLRGRLLGASALTLAVVIGATVAGWVLPPALLVLSLAWGAWAGLSPRPSSR